MRTIPSLTTARLELRSFAPTDFHNLFGWLSLHDVSQYLNMDDCSEAAIKSWLYERLPNAKGMGKRHFSWAVTPKGSFQVIGNVELWSTGIGRRPAAELGFAMDPAYQGLGLMGEAVLKVLYFAFIHLQTHRVQATVMVDNYPSIRLLEKYKFLKEGRLRNWVQTKAYQGDAYIYSLLIDEFNQLNLS